MGITANEIMKFISEDLLDKLSAESKVDKKNTYKLRGKEVFQFLLYSLIEEDRISLRVLEDVLKKQKFKFYFSASRLDFSRSGLSERLKTIPIDFSKRYLMR